MSITLARLGVVAGSFPVLAGGDFESIATVTVGSGGAASIEFTSISGSYQHLQLRMVARSSESAATSDINVRVGDSSIDTGSNYANHLLYGTGSAAAAAAYSSASTMWLGAVPGATATASTFGAVVLDILDYANTSKNTTLRGFSGNDRNGAGAVLMTSGLWINTSSLGQIRVYPGAGNLVEHSTAALYGIKA